MALKMASKKAPNILFIMADQMSASALPMHGGPALMPSLSRIAESGTVFDAAYCSSPICCPSRASMMAGRLPHKIGAYDNSCEFPASIPTFAHYLRNLGYKTCLSGKMHFVGPDQLHGFEERVTTDIYASDFTWAADWSRENLTYSPSAMSPAGVIEGGLCARSLQIDYDEEVTYAARRKLFDHARFDGDTPLFMCASYTHPHNPFITTQEYWDRYENVEIPDPKVPYIPYEQRDAWAQRYFKVIRQDEYDVPDDALTRARRAYYAMMSFVDDQIASLVQTLEETGMADNTVVVFASDHGEMLGERGMWFKFNPFEDSIKVPLIVNVPGQVQPARESRAVSLLDLFPTFLEMGAVEAAPEVVGGIDGQSLVGMLAGEGDERVDEAAVEYHAEGVGAPAIILVREGMKYVHCGDDPGLLFDLTADPLELANLAETEAHAATAAAMRADIEARWDLADIKACALKSQAERRVVQQAIHTGQHTAWDYTPPVDGTKQYVRPDPSIQSTTDIKRRARLPYVAAAVADRPRG